MTIHDTGAFLRAWLAAPLRVASVVPSGPALSRLITSEVLPGSGHIVELGAGTGVFTRALLDRGIDESDLTLVEFDMDLAMLLRRKFPRARVLRMDAAGLGAAGLLTLSPISAVISGLPLLGMPNDKVAAILSGSIRTAARRRSLLPVHLWPQLSRAPGGARIARASGGSHRTRSGKPAARGGLSDRKKSFGQQRNFVIGRNWPCRRPVGVPKQKPATAAHCGCQSVPREQIVGVLRESRLRPCRNATAAFFPNSAFTKNSSRSGLTANDRSHKCENKHSH